MSHFVPRILMAVLALTIAAPVAVAQQVVTGNTYPVPNNVFTAPGQLAVSSSPQNLSALSEGLSGQVLTGSGAGVAPVWTTSPSLAAVTVGGAGTALTQVRIYAQTLTPVSVAAASCAEQSFTVTGLTTADKVFLNGVAPTNAAVPVGARAAGANTLAVTWCNPTAGALTPAAGAASILAVRS